MLAYALRFYGGRVSQLVQALGTWMEENRPGRRVDASAIEEFIACAHEPRHHLTSLVRYTIGTRGIRQAHPRPPANPAPSPGATYILSSGAVLFDNLHDCGTLLERIRMEPDDAAPFDDASTGACGDYLVVVSGGQLKNYAVSNGLLTILKIFQQPRMYDEVASALGGREPLLEELIALGVLAPASS